MLLRQETLRGIEEGRVTLAFRRWRRPTVKAGGTLLTSAGLLAIDAIDRVDPAELTDAEAHAAGFSDLEALSTALAKERKGSVYRIALHLVGPDPRIELRDRIPEDAGAFEEILSRLNRWDASSKAGPWTRDVMALLVRRPEVRAADLADELGMEKGRLKVNVRKLKGLGLTESLEVGYRLSPRGKAVLKRSKR